MATIVETLRHGLSKIKCKELFWICNRSTEIVFRVYSSPDNKG